MLNIGKDYEPPIQFLLKRNYYYREDIINLPPIKDICHESGLSYTKLRKQVNDLYEDLATTVDQDSTLSFGKVEYYFYLNGYNQSIGFKATDLPVLPRIGESIDIPFFRTYLKARSYYVEDIHHYFDENGQSIHITLNHGHYNLYWHYRKDKAHEEEEIHWRELIHLNDYELKKRLNVGRWSRDNQSDF